MHGKILNKPFRLNPSTVLFLLLLAVSIMCMPACSSDSDNAAVQPNYIVQATVSVEEDGPVAYAFVMDGDKNLVSTLNLTINGDLMTIEYLDGDDGSPYYIMDLPDLKGGYMVVFEARDQFGVIIYAPEPAVIPMAIELLEPEEGQEVMAGDEVIIRWTGGEGAEVFSAAYAALDGSALFWDDLEPSESGAYTVPAGQTVEGAGIVGVGAITGGTTVIGTLNSDFITYESYFLVSREAGIQISVRAAETSSATRTALGRCHYKGGGYKKSDAARTSCGFQFAALGIGAMVWETRRQLDLKIQGNKPCANTTNVMSYCAMYGTVHGFAYWRTECLACASPCYWYESYGFRRCDCSGGTVSAAPVFVDPRSEYCSNPCSGYHYCPNN